MEINDYKEKVKLLIDTGYRVRIQSYISSGIEIFRMKSVFLIFYTVIFIACMFIPVINLIIFMPLVAGFFISAYFLVNKKELHFENMFNGFQNFAGLLLFTLISSVLITLGFFVLIIPGIYLAVCYIFTPFFIIFGKMDFWEAMETSRKLVHKEWFSIFVFLLVIVFLNLLGILAFGIGILFTLPVSYCAIFIAFEDIVGIKM